MNPLLQTSQSLPLASQTDEALAGFAQDGHKEAFSELVRRYQNPVFNYLYRMLSDPGLTEEIAQETFVQAYLSLANFKSEGRFKPWLFGIAANQAKSHWRKQTRRNQHEADWEEANPELIAENRLTHTADTVEQLIEQKLTTESLLAHMQQMDSRYRSVLLLRFQEDLTYEHIAEAMKVPLNTVRTWLRRGKDQLRAFYTQTTQEKDDG
jgi:RNA polymerase sigma-70 factor (ECF subfamily)